MLAKGCDALAVLDSHTNMGYACLSQGMWLYYLGLHHQFQICDWDRLSYREVAEKGSQLRLL